MDEQPASRKLEVQWGADIPYEDCHVVALWWQSVKINEPADIKKAAKLANAAQTGPTTGLYAFEGRRDGMAAPGILYIGQSGADDEDGDPGQPLGARLTQSFAKLSYKARGRSYLFSDVWDVTVRFAHLARQHVRLIESLLVHAHAPPFNAQHVRRALNPAQDYLVLNAGDKGGLLPMAASIYYRADCWPAPPQES